jgi:hypothetical protein
MSCGPLIFSTLYELDGTNGSYVFNGNEHIFTFDISNSITFTVLNCDTGFDDYKTNILIVGGGGSGGEKSSFGYSGGGGGGGGQVIYNTDITINPNTPYDVIIGSGGAPVGGSNTGNSTPGNDGGTSSMFGYVANGGKGGGYAPPTDLSGGIGGNGGSGSGYTGKGGDGGNSLNTNCNYSGNFGSLVNGVYYGGGGGGGSYLSQSSCGNEVDTVGNCYGRGGYGGEGGGGNGGSAMPVACRTITPISASSSNNGTPNSGGGGAGQNGNPDVSNFSGAGGSGLVILYIYGPSHGCHWNPALANLTTVWSRGTGNCVDLSGATLPDGNPMTYDDLSEKRKAVIFQYKNNNAGFSKKQNFSRLARGIGKQRGNTFATQSQTYTNPNTLNLTQVGSTLQCSSGRRNWALTNQNDTPGPVRRITNYPTVPLTNYNVRRTYLAGGTKWPQYGPNNG